MGLRNMNLLVVLIERMRKFKFSQYCVVILILITVLSLAIKINLVNHEFFENGQADSSQRLLLAKSLFHEPYSWLIYKGWVELWPPGQFLVLEGLYSFIKATNLAGFAHWTQISLYVPIIMFALSIWLMFFITKKEYGEKSALYSSLIFCFISILNHLSMSGLAETYAIFFVALTMFLLYVHDERRKKIYLLLASIALFWGIICRAEVVFLIPVFVIYLLPRVSKRNIIGFVLISISFYLLKYFLVFIGIINLPVRYYNAAKLSGFYDYYSLSSQIRRFTPFLRTAVFAFSPILFSIGLCYVMLRLKEIRHKLSFLIAATYLLVIFCLMLSGNIGISLRYLAIGIFAFVPTIGGGLVYFENALRRSFGAFSYCFVIIVLFLSLLPQVYDIKDGSFGNKPTREVLECRSWLQTNLNPSDVVFFDFLDNWDQYLHAEIEDLSRQRILWSYSFYPPPSQGIDLSAYKNKRQAIAIDFILNNQPKYLVVSTEKKYRKLKQFKIRPKHQLVSYVREFMVLSPEEGLSLNINGKVLPLVERFSNEDFIVYQGKYDRGYF